MTDIQKITREVRLEPVVFRTGWRRWLWAMTELGEVLTIAITLGLVLTLTRVEISQHQFILRYYLISGLMLVMGAGAVVGTLPSVARRADKSTYRNWYDQMTADDGPIGKLVHYWTTQVWYMYSAELRTDGTVVVVANINHEDVHLVLKRDSYRIGISAGLSPTIRSIDVSCDLPASPHPLVMARTRAGNYETVTVTMFEGAELRRPAGSLLGPALALTSV